MSVDVNVIENKKTTIDKLKDDFKKWNVVFYNDNVTTVDFVIFVLKEIFKYDETGANDITMKIHNNGKEIVGTYTYEVAEQKATDTLYLAYQYGYPLKVKVIKDH